MKYAITLLAAAAFSVTQSQSAFFQNLGFESPTFVPVLGLGYQGSVDPVQALPGWTTYVGDSPATFILHDNQFLDSAGVSILDATNYYPFVPFDGQYTLLLQGGFSIPFMNRLSVAIAQTALIPSWARSVTFEVSGGHFAFTVGGHSLSPPVFLSSGPNYAIEAVDISAFAGTTEELRFTVFPNPPPGLAINNVFLDAITFSPNVVPEPNTWVLAVGLLATWAFRRHSLLRRAARGGL
jgi:hypothetical protein